MVDESCGTFFMIFCGLFYDACVVKYTINIHFAETACTTKAFNVVLHIRDDSLHGSKGERLNCI